MESRHQEEIARLKLAHMETLRSLENNRLALERRLDEAEEKGIIVAERYQQAAETLSARLQRMEKTFDQSIQTQRELEAKLNAKRQRLEDLAQERLALEITLERLNNLVTISKQNEQITQNKLDSAEATIASLNKQSSIWEQNQNEFRTKVEQDRQRLTEKIEKLNQLLSCSEQKTQELQGKRIEADARIQFLEKSCSIWEKKQEELQKEAEQYSQALAKSEKSRQTLQEALDKANANVKLLEQEHGSHEKEQKRLIKKVEQYQASWQASEQKAARIMDGMSYQLGYALCHGFKTVKSFCSLPGTLWSIGKETRRRKREGEKYSKLIRNQKLEKVKTIFSTQGLIKAEQYALDNFSLPADQATALTTLAKVQRAKCGDNVIRLARESYRLDPRSFRQKWLAFQLFHAGQLTEAETLLDALPPELQLSKSEISQAARIRKTVTLLTMPLPTLKIEPQRTIKPNHKFVLHVVSSCLPFHATDYTCRTQALASVLTKTGWSPICVACCNYQKSQLDSSFFNDTLKQKFEYKNVKYVLLSGPPFYQVPFDQYFKITADLLVKQIERLRPELIHAASNYETALPALMAARHVGLPFIYEVRELGEYTRIAQFPEWENSEAFHLHKKLESFIISNADHVLALTAPLVDELKHRGAVNISLLPDAADPNTFKPLDCDQALSEKLGLQPDHFVIGYIGSLEIYEGIDDLIRAFGIIHRKHRRARLLIAGGGSYLEMLQSLVVELDITDAVIFAGPVPADQTSRYYSLLGATTLPRKPHITCQMLPPPKAYEIMLMGIPLVISDAIPPQDMVKPDETALICKAGDYKSLATKLQSLIENSEMATRLKNFACEEVKNNHSLITVGENLDAIYNNLLKKHEKTHHHTPTANTKADSPNTVAPKLKTSPSRSEAPYKNASTDSPASASETENRESFFGSLRSRVQSLKPGAAAENKLEKAHLLLERGEHEAAIQLVNTALALKPNRANLRRAIRLLYDSALVNQAVELTDRMMALADLGEADVKFISRVRTRGQLLVAAASPPQQLKFRPVDNRIANILAFCLPFASVGYATRSHGLALGIQKNGWDIRPYARPGFPIDGSKSVEGDLSDHIKIEGIGYRFNYEIKRNAMSEEEYLSKSADFWEARFRSEKPTLVHAASNYVTALPALIAARRVGLPFIYEVRGSWELTRQSQDESFARTAKYLHMVNHEGVMVQQADHVLALTQALKEYLTEKYGVPEEKITVVPNCVDPDRFAPLPRDAVLADKLGLPQATPVIGYVGSFVDYEGLDDLLTAAGELKRQGLIFKILLVGDGAVFSSLEKQIFDLELGDRVIMTGRVAHEDVEKYYSLIDIAPFPRKPWPICELVSPLKPFEAMAQEKAVVVSNTRALSELVKENETGLLFEKGRVDSLADALAQLITSPEHRQILGQNARQWVQQERTWEVAGRLCGMVYQTLLAEGTHRNITNS